MDNGQDSTRYPRILSSAERQQRVIPLSFQLAGVALNVLSLVHNEWAAGVLSRLFFTVFKSEPKPWVAEFWQSADECVEVSVDEVSIPVRLWGQGPLIVLMHGWSGTGTQYQHFIPPLVEAGFRVACFDAPEHGSNPGRKSHMLRFKSSLIAIQNEIGPIDTVIAHSLGGMATTFAVQQGLTPTRVVLIAPHLNVQKIFETYRDLLSMRPRLAQRFRERIGERMAALTDGLDPWEDFIPSRLLDQSQLRGMLVYDSEDPEISAIQFEEMARLWRNSMVHNTRGLGHNRILKDAAVIDTIANYLKS